MVRCASELLGKCRAWYHCCRCYDWIQEKTAGKPREIGQGLEGGECEVQYVGAEQHDDDASDDTLCQIRNVAQGLAEATTALNKQARPSDARMRFMGVLHVQRPASSKSHSSRCTVDAMRRVDLS